MHVGHRALVVALLLGVAGVLAVPTVGADGGVARSCAQSAGALENVSAEGASDVTATTATLEGLAFLGNDTEVTGWFEYRVAGAGVDWRTTNRTDALVDACGRAWFRAPLTGLAPNTSYAYRAVAAAGDGTARSDEVGFRTAHRDGSGATAMATPTAGTEGAPATPTHTPTPEACPQYRGAGALCTPARTPTPYVDTPMTPSGESDVDREAGREGTPGPVEWLGGLLPLFAWAAAMVVLAPLVLGGLLGLDTLRGRE